LSDRRTTFVVISTLEATPVREAEFFATELVRRDLNLGAIVLNKVLPSYFRSTKNISVAKTMAERAKDLVERLDVDRPLAARVLSDVAESFLNFSVVARREPSSKTSSRPAPKCSPPSVLRRGHRRHGGVATPGREALDLKYDAPSAGRPPPTMRVCALSPQSVGPPRRTMLDYHLHLWPHDESEVPSPSSGSPRTASGRCRWE